MNKRLKIVCAAMMCVAALLLSACDNGRQAPTQNETAAQTEAESSEAATQSATDGSFFGVWKLAAAHTDGLTIAGDFSMLFRDVESIAMELRDDSTATMSFGDIDVDFTWEKVDDANLRVVRPSDEADVDATGVLGAYETADLSLKDHSLVMSFGEGDEVSTELVFTADGSLKGYEPLATDKAADIATSDDLVGTWRLSGLRISTVTLYGTADVLAELVDASTDTTMTINEDGTGTVMGSSFTWKREDKTTVFNYDDKTVTIKSLDGDLILDMTSMLGGKIDTVMRFAKEQ